MAAPLASSVPATFSGPAVPVEAHAPVDRPAHPWAPMIDEVYDPSADPDNGWRPGRARVGDVTADQVRRARFRTVGDAGYAQVDVDDFLDQVEATLSLWEERARVQQAEAETTAAAFGRWPFVRESAGQRQVAPSGLTLISRGLGYDVGEVDAFLEHAAVALELLAQGVVPEMTPQMVEQSLFRMTLDSGYDQKEVDQLLDQVAEALRGGPRGQDRSHRR